MIQIRKVDSIDQLRHLKTQYLTQTTAPLDGMWLSGFLPVSDHFGLYENDRLVGYFCISSDGYLLQFHMCEEHLYQQHPSQNRCDQAAAVFGRIMNNEGAVVAQVKGAFVSTAEPQYLSHCFDHCSKFEVNALMYQLPDQSGPRPSPGIGQSQDEALPLDESLMEVLPMNRVQIEQIDELIAFAKANIGAPEQWLAGYYTNLINRRELFGFWQHGRLQAAGESRGNDEFQTDYADLGVIVDESARGKGLATLVLKQLVLTARARGLIPICSTEKGNTGAQRAINRAGFVAKHRIVRFDA